ncbi:hypothetical protein KKG08_02720, partial [Patescibacteria group bacterium]|nr:hypothetical protein [Patescibacteria group bacterium]
MRKILMSLLLSSLILISGSSYKAYAKECPIGLSNYKCSISCTGDWQVAIDTSNPYTCFGLGGGACCKKTEEALSKENTCGGEGGECKSVNPSDNEHVCHQAGSWGDYGCGTNEHCWICYENVNYDRTMDEIDPEESALIDVAKQQREDAIRHNYAPPVDRGYSGPIFTSFTDVVAPVAKVL